jgi:N-hydroxyarylamine O-acetyltransferase
MTRPLELKHYFKRIGFEGSPKLDLPTLTTIHRAHSDAIAYENYDIHLKRPLTFDVPAIFGKIVESRRGGWCYEMNGLLAWALESIGFRVTRLAGAVMRDSLGDGALGRHLVLLVHLDRPYIADVGFGDGIVDPIPLEAGRFAQRGLDFGLSKIDGDWWRFHNQPQGGALSFDFTTKPASVAVLEEKCRWLQSDPASPFVQNMVAQRHQPGAHYTLRGRVLKTLKDGRPGEQRVIADAGEFDDVLKSVFDLDIPDSRSLWPKILTRHKELFGSN